MSAKFIPSFYNINITYAWTNGWTDKQTERLHKRDGTHWPSGRNHTDWIYMYLRTENKDRRTNWMNRQTDGRTTWRTDWWTGKKDRADGQTDWMDGRTNRRDGQTKQTGRTDQTDWMQGQMHKTNGLKGQTREHMERMHALDKTTRRADGQTNWTELNNSWIRFSYDLKYYPDLGASDYSQSHSIIAKWLLLQLTRYLSYLESFLNASL